MKNLREVPGEAQKNKAAIGHRQAEHSLRYADG